jgi:hypothetical protein
MNLLASPSAGKEFSRGALIAAVGKETRRHRVKAPSDATHSDVHGHSPLPSRSELARNTIKLRP